MYQPNKNNTNEIDQKRLLFIVTSFWAYGELLIALEFASRAVRLGHKVHFFISAKHKKIIQNYGISYTVLIPKSRNINRILFKDNEDQFKPTHVILADFLNFHFCETHYGLLHEDLEIFSGSIGAFDNFDWENSSQIMDTYGFRAKNMDSIDISKYQFRLCPSPIAFPRESDPVQKYYPLIDKVLPYDRDIRDRRKKELNLDTGKKIILTTSATWQETYKAYPDVDNFVQAANRAFKSIIAGLSQKYIILCVGPESFFSPGEINENYRLFSQMEPALFNKYMQASDLFLSRNLTSTTQARAVCSRVPTVLLMNSVFYNGEEQKQKRLKQMNSDGIAAALESLERCYPYYMFPVGWYKFLRPVIKDNPYADAYKSLEIFNMENATAQIINLLEDKNEQEQLINKVNILNGALSGLPSAAQVINSLEGSPVTV